MKASYNPKGQRIEDRKAFLQLAMSVMFWSVCPRSLTFSNLQPSRAYQSTTQRTILLNSPKKNFTLFVQFHPFSLLFSHKSAQEGQKRHSLTSELVRRGEIRVLERFVAPDQDQTIENQTNSRQDLKAKFDHKRTEKI